MWLHASATPNQPFCIPPSSLPCRGRRPRWAPAMRIPPSSSLTHPSRSKTRCSLYWLLWSLVLVESQCCSNSLMKPLLTGQQTCLFGRKRHSGRAQTVRGKPRRRRVLHVLDLLPRGWRWAGENQTGESAEIRNHIAFTLRPCPHVCGNFFSVIYAVWPFTHIQVLRSLKTELLENFFQDEHFPYVPFVWHHHLCATLVCAVLNS